MASALRMRLATLTVALTLIGTLIAPIANAVAVRSLTDRSDDVKGPQIHLIYLVPKDAQDQNWDTTGQIKTWVDQSQSWLRSQGSKELRYDTFSGHLDISYLKSKLTIAEMKTAAIASSYDSSLLPMLLSEFLVQSPTRNYAESPKTYIFVTGQSVKADACGFASAYIGGIIWTGGGCWSGPQDDRTDPYGMSWPSRALIHEVVHTYGVMHVCDSTQDLMWGTPECTGTMSYAMTLIDVNRNDYYGGEKAGADIAQLPIWSDSPSITTYSTVKAINTYTTYTGDDYTFVIGRDENKISWEWSRIWGYRIGNYLECSLTNGKETLTAKIIENRCFFEIPLTWRGGVTATVTGKIWASPYSGQTQEKIKILNPEFQYQSCTSKYCFVGETLELRSKYCYYTDSKFFTLEQYVDGQWKKIGTTGTRPKANCEPNTFEPIPIKFSFTKSGNFVYRWVEGDTSTSRGYVEPINSLSILDANAQYPVATKATELNKEAAALKEEAAKKSEADRLARELYARQLNQCATSATNCYVGESFVVPRLCFVSGIGVMRLEILKDKRWETVTEGVATSDPKTCGDTYVSTPGFSMIFQEPGLKVLRWIAAPGGKYTYTSKPYGVLIMRKEDGEPTATALATATSDAVILAKEADDLLAAEAAAKKAEEERLAREVAEKAAAEKRAEEERVAKEAADAAAKKAEEDRLAREAAAKAATANKKTTITCVKGKVTTKVTAVRPVCPKGYVKK